MRPSIRLVITSANPTGNSPAPWLGRIRVWLARDHGATVRTIEIHAEGKAHAKATHNATAAHAPAQAGLASRPR